MDQVYKSGVILKLTQRDIGPDGHVGVVQRRMDRVSANPRRGWLESIRGNRVLPVLQRTTVDMRSKHKRAVTRLTYPETIETTD